VKFQEHFDFQWAKENNKLGEENENSSTTGTTIKTTQDNSENN
jgi:hypothetical protein